MGVSKLSTSFRVAPTDEIVSRGAEGRVEKCENDITMPLRCSDNLGVANCKAK